MNSKSPNNDPIQTPLRVIGRYSASGEIEIRGDKQALLSWAESLADNHNASISLVVPQAPANPYDSFLVAMYILRADEAVRIKLNGETLVISGSQEKLKLLADNIKWLAVCENSVESGQIENHLHVEYYQGHFFLDPKSDSLIIVLQEFAERLLIDGE